MNYPKNRGVIFNIQRFSLHDGPSIRTNIFFKGCSLRCAWCSNPEGQESRINYFVSPYKCKLNCDSCIRNCNVHRQYHYQLLFLYIFLW